MKQLIWLRIIHSDGYVRHYAFLVVNAREEEDLLCLQVYIVTMEQEKEQQRQKQSKQLSASHAGGLSPEDDVDEDEGQGYGDYMATDGESLLSLVQPEMKMLSHHWLAALRDYALLSLPPGFMFMLTSFNCCQ